MKVTILGCGSSVGTPAAGNYWGKCNPQNPKNHRTRASLLVEDGKTDILIDATVDLREHLNRANKNKIDALLLSHAHSDHINGMDDLRVISYHLGRAIDTYSNEYTINDITHRFSYIFKGAFDVYKPFLKTNIVSQNTSIKIGDINIDIFLQDHGTCDSLGFRFDNFAYSVDMKYLNEESLEKLKGLDVWIVDAAANDAETHVSHAGLKQIYEWVDYLKPKMTYLTVLTNFMDYDELCKNLPDNIRPAYDGMVLEF